ncbi:4Fe-4S dicluster domain-containing protein [Desulfobacca acetoxidans]
MEQFEGPFLSVDPQRCMGCHTCELACAAAHTRAGSIIGAVLARERLHRRNRVVQVDGVKLPVQCRQCQDAPCVRVCPTGATYRTETYTAVDQARCIGCRLCMMVCPFGAIHVATTTVAGQERRAAFKCDLCVNRLGGPACVAACPTQALSLRYPQQEADLASQAAARQFLRSLASQPQLGS